MASNFRLTLIAPTEYNVETFSNEVELWQKTDENKTSVSRHISDKDRDSVMKIKGKTWKFGDGYTFSSGLCFDDSVDGKREGVYKDFSVSSGVRYAISFLYKTIIGSFDFVVYDQDNGNVILTENLRSLTWADYEETIVVPDNCKTLRIKFLQTDSAHSTPFCIDNFSINGNALLSDPDNYERLSEKIGGMHQTLSGRRIYDLSAIHYKFGLGWNYFDSIQYELLRELFYSNELIYFDDGDVPPLIETETIYDSAKYNFMDVSNPSSKHKAYKSSSFALPFSRDDFEEYEFETNDYQAISTEDESYVESLNPTEGEYLYHKFLIKSDIPKDNVVRFSVRVVVGGSDSSPADIDGVILYGYDGNKWVELGRCTNSAKTELTYNTVKTEIAREFIDKDDGYIRLLLRSRSSRSSSYELNIRTYYVEAEINEGLSGKIKLSHKAILDHNGGVIYVKNLTQGKELKLYNDYTVSVDRRSIEVKGQNSGDEIEVKYNRYFEVTFTTIPEEWLYGDGEVRSVEIVLQTLSESK